MTENDERMRNIACTGKHRHESMGAANRQINKKQADKFTRFGGNELKLSAYRCSFCNGYHIGKTPIFRGKRKRKL